VKEKFSDAAVMQKYRVLHTLKYLCLPMANSVFKRQSQYIKAFLAKNSLERKKLIVFEVRN